MGRIPDEEIHRLKRDVSLEQLVQTRGIALMKTGANLVGLCPFHDDREPSLVITPESNLWHCLGACQAGGSVIDFVMRAEGVSFRHAVELLRRDAVPARAGGGLPPKRTTLCKLEPLASETAEDAALMSRVVDHYEATLLESAEGRQYLEGRGLAGEEVIRHFKLGLANRTLGYQLPHSTTKAGQALRGRLAELRGDAHDGARAPVGLSGGAALGRRGSRGAALRPAPRARQAQHEAPVSAGQSPRRFQRVWTALGSRGLNPCGVAT